MGMFLLGTISVLLFFGSLIGLCVLLITQNNTANTSHRSFAPEYGVDLRSLIARYTRYWKRYGIHYWQQGIAVGGTVSKRILYRALTHIQKALMKLIRYIEHHESKSRQALRERKSQKETLQ
jgi:hypothetical protein